jgi:hypothetical protein
MAKCVDARGVYIDKTLSSHRVDHHRVQRAIMLSVKREGTRLAHLSMYTVLASASFARRKPADLYRRTAAVLSSSTCKNSSLTPRQSRAILSAPLRSSAPIPLLRKPSLFRAISVHVSSQSESFAKKRMRESKSSPGACAAGPSQDIKAALFRRPC